MFTRPELPENWASAYKAQTTREMGKLFPWPILPENGGNVYKAETTIKLGNFTQGPN